MTLLSDYILDYFVKCGLPQTLQYLIYMRYAVPMLLDARFRRRITPSCATFYIIQPTSPPLPPIHYLRHHYHPTQAPHTPNPSSAPPPPPICPAVFCICEIYVLLTVFHMAIYFSIHDDRQLSSRFEREVPGEGMHFSKQWPLSFCEDEVSVLRDRFVGEGVVGG